MRIIYVDDEQPNLDNFKFTVKDFPEIKSLDMFRSGEEALEFARKNVVDVAFCDIEMPGLHGLALAEKLKIINPNTRAVFVTAYSQYAMDAWGVDATGYVMKPYLASDIKKELNKCKNVPLPSNNRVVITTMPGFSVSAGGKAVNINSAKARELLALIVDAGDKGITSSEGIAALWPDRPNDANTQSLFRMTFKRLCDCLEDANADDIIESRGNRRFIRADMVDCDLYRILSGDAEEIKKYSGLYLQEYNGQRKETHNCIIIASIKYIKQTKGETIYGVV